MVNEVRIQFSGKALTLLSMDKVLCWFSSATLVPQKAALEKIKKRE